MYSNQFQQQIKPMVQIEPLIKLAEIAKVDSDINIQKYLLALSLNNDQKMANDFASAIHYKAVYELLEKFPFNTPSDQTLKPFIGNNRILGIGKILKTDHGFAYPLDLLNRHCLILGATGTGKTNLIMSLILQCIMHRVSILIFDKDKEDYRHLYRIMPSIKIINAKKLPFNPLQPPPYVDPEHWRVIFVQVFCKSNDLLGGSESMLLDAMEELYQEYGILSGSDTYPTLIDLEEKIASYDLRGKYRALGFQDSLLNRFGAYRALNKDMFEYSKGVPVDYLSSQNIVIEVKALTDRVSRFFMNIILYGMFLYKIASGQRGNILRNAVFVDEAKWLAPPGHNDLLGFSPLSSVLAQSREAGIGLIIGDQTAYLDRAVFVNTRIKYCFQLGCGEDIEKVRMSMALTKEQADYIPKLDTGECIVRIPMEDPFVVKTLKVNFQ